MSNWKVKLHEKVVSMVFDDVNQRLFSAGTERKLMITDLRHNLNGTRMFTFIKLSNSSVATLEIA